MAPFKGMVRLVGDAASLPATIDLRDGALEITSAGTDLGQWPLTGLVLEERPSGFLLSVEGEQLFLSVLDRASFLRSLSAETAALVKTERRAGRRTLRRRAKADAVAAGAAADPAGPVAAPDRPAGPTPTEPEDSTEPIGRRRRLRRRTPPVAPTASTQPIARQAPPPGVVGDLPAPADGTAARGRRLRLPMPSFSRGAGRPGRAPDDDRGGEAPARLRDRLVEGFRTTSTRQRIVGGAALIALVLAVFAPQVLALIVVSAGGLLVLGGTIAYLDPYTAVRLPAPWTATRLMALGGTLVAVVVLVPLLPFV